MDTVCQLLTVCRQFEFLNENTHNFHLFIFYAVGVWGIFNFNIKSICDVLLSIYICLHIYQSTNEDGILLLLFYFTLTE